MLVLCVQARGGFHWEECHGLGCVKLRSLTKLQIMGWSEACWIDPRRSCVPVRLCRLPDQTPPARARAKLWAAWFLERHDGVHERRTRTGRQASRGQKVRYAWAQWRVNAAHRFAPRKFFFLGSDPYRLPAGAIEIDVTLAVAGGEEISLHDVRSWIDSMPWSGQSHTRVVMQKRDVAAKGP